MFTAGRILLRKKDRPEPIFGDRRDSRQRRKFRCYVPFVRQSVLAAVAGFVVIATGISLCIAGFFMGHQPRSQVQKANNDTEVFSV